MCSKTCAFSTLNSGLRDETGQCTTACALLVSFSTLNSGLRDETGGVAGAEFGPQTFSTLNSGLRDETFVFYDSAHDNLKLSVPSTRAYAMKPAGSRFSNGQTRSFSTLNSGLRDETCATLPFNAVIVTPFSTLNSGLRDETRYVLLHSAARQRLSVPSTRAYAMKQSPGAFTLQDLWTFQYPRIGPTK